MASYNKIMIIILSINHLSHSSKAIVSSDSSLLLSDETSPSVEIEVVEAVELEGTDSNFL